MSNRTFRDVLRELADGAQSTVEKGHSFERLVKAFLEQDKAQSERFAKVWMWGDWPGNGGRHDTGIDLVAEERDTGDLVAIQCKFYGEDNSIALEQLNKFLTAYGVIQFASGIMVATTDNWTRDADNAIREARNKPVARWGPDIFENSSIDWSAFDLDNPSGALRRPTKILRDYQQEALNAVIEGSKQHDRGKLIMACGTGKTFTALRIAEQQVGAGGTVLFLTPSISLLSQSLLDWANDADVPLKTYAVCSDTRAGKRSSDDEDISPYDLRDTPSTNSDHLVARYNAAKRDGYMTAIFSTYQSLDVVAEAQRKGLPQFGIIICDEAHRTTGASLVGESESNFQRVHNNSFVAADKRLYMTATPRIYGDRAKRKANENRLTLASMDNEQVYGPEFHRLGFGRAIELGILSQYKVVIFNVDQEQVGIDLDSLLSDRATDINMDNAARMVGCWNGLGKRGASGFDFTTDPLPAKRAVAFSNTINQSKQFSQYFSTIIEGCLNAAGANAENQLFCQVHHVDGTQNALVRSERLDWLRQEPAKGVCKVLSNARCLTEGIDVPALDAILFLHPRKSDIDVVQAVGRVMRRSEGKEFGYIILPIAQAPKATAQESVSNSAYKAVWQVINAISAHDDRFEAQINQLALTYERDKPEYPGETGIGRGEPGDGATSTDDLGIQGTLPLIIAGSAELRDVILARIVDRYADPGYWEKWATDVQAIARRHEARIRALLAIEDSGVRPVFDNFLTGLRHNLNDGITEDDAIGMLSQHLITKPVFDALFEGYAFAQSNPVSRAMQTTLESLQERGLEKETEGLENFYRDVRVCVQGITDAASKQKIIAELYQRFFKLALPDTAARLGIVYTPVEVVDYIVRSVEDVLNREFDASVSDEGVHVLDPFVGTGTFITRLLRSGLIRPEDLRRKYESELHANDIMLLAYYVAAINIESTYHDLADSDEYHPFNGIVLTDTFQSYEEADPMDEFLFPRNNERIERQKGLDIRVIVGNPPWSATNNRAYSTIDRQVQQHYVEASAATKLSALYDPYVRAIRLASDRIQSSEHGGIVAFVTNGGFIESNGFDGFRKVLAEEFHAVYCFNLRGDQRTAGEKSRQEGGKIFGQESRAGVAILLLVKKPSESPGATIHYRDIGDYLPREAKLEILAESQLATTAWQVITPNEYGDWIGQRSDAFKTLRPLAQTGGTDTPVFNQQTLGLATNRDAWCYGSSRKQLEQNIKDSVSFYNEQVAQFRQTNSVGSLKARTEKAKSFVGNTPRQFHWSRENSQDLANGNTYQVYEVNFVVSSYRPFFKQHLYFSGDLNNSIREFPEIYPVSGNDNLTINLTRAGAASPFHVLMTDNIPDLHLNGDTITLSRYRYVPAQTLTRARDPDNPELERVSNINPAALAQFREHYGAPEISEDDLFFYTYGVLHSRQWREKFADDLAKSAARIPMAPTADDFRAFAEAGRELADLHVNYETVKPYRLEESCGPGWNPEAPNAYRVEKMAYAGPVRNPDRTSIVCNSHITMTGIPLQAHEYRLGSRSALDWLIDRYQVKTDSKSGITNDPNDWATEHGQPRYIIDLVKRVTAISVRTVEIVNRLPYLRFDDDADLPPPDPETFRKLADQWEEDTIYLSNLRQAARHPAHQEILDMGAAAVPLILKRLKDKGGHWFSTLRTITAADPVTAEDRGNVPAMTAAWLEWGKRNGYA